MKKTFYILLGIGILSAWGKQMILKPVASDQTF